MAAVSRSELTRSFWRGFSRTFGIFPARRATLDEALDARMVAIHAKLGLREASRTVDEDGVPHIKLERIEKTES